MFLTIFTIGSLHNIEFLLTAFCVFGTKHLFTVHYFRESNKIAIFIGCKIERNPIFINFFSSNAILDCLTGCVQL